MVSCATEVLRSNHASKLSSRHERLSFLQNKSLYALVKDYRLYVEHDSILVFEHEVESWLGRASRKRWVTHGNKQSWGGQKKCLERGSVETETVGVLASKRGNKAYAYRVKRSLHGLAEEFDGDIFDYVASPFANVLSITFTDDRALSRHEQVLNIHTWYNQFKAWLRSKVGDFSAFVTNECFDDGYLHLHAIFVFTEMYWEVFEQLSFNKHTGKREVHWLVQDADFISSGYEHGFLKMEAVTSIQGMVNYLVKYITKSAYLSPEMTDESKVVKTLATLSAYGKRAFAVSGEFREAFNSIRYSLSKRNKVQYSLFGVVVPYNKWRYRGTVPADLLGLAGNKRFFDLSKYQVGLCDSFFEECLNGKSCKYEE